ncbi:hypothetical protein GPUN_1398 [Glaciecola punicea ACAM 611]|jgi:LPS O-antigen subunit length determinant protein (WzzB/FepE family)|uniref:Uncharacterized protein n=1 Tax=Glaciecola punicea ACAM 611 TaxID=1121923 RepID=H5TB45_9ALTE|nr:hypothetical protein [Glaciecola punicea]GAB55522.1 hypothetical protein GPUN_1398 [Glaciecola punicea ACAM 611]
MTKHLTQQKLLDDEIDSRELTASIWTGKWSGVGVTFLLSVLAIIYALSTPNM